MYRIQYIQNMSKLPGLHSKACGPGRKIEFERQQKLFDKCVCGKQQNDFTRTGKLFDKYFCANRKVVDLLDCNDLCRIFAGEEAVVRVPHKALPRLPTHKM